jgi:hypothetical protein
MRLVPKKKFILLIHQLQCGHLQSTSLVPAHTFPSSAAIICNIPGTHLVGCRLRPVLIAPLMPSVDSKWCPFYVDFTF